MKTNKQVVRDFKVLGVTLTKRQVSKVRMGRGSLPQAAARFIRQGRFKNAAKVIEEEAK